MNLEDRIKKLREEFVELLAEEKKVKEPIYERHRKQAEEEAEEAVENLRREFAIKFEVVRQMKGVRRADIEQIVFKSKGNPRYRQFVELAGGQLQKHESAETRFERERKEAEERREELLDGLTYLGFIRPWGDANNLEAHAFEILGVGTFYLQGEYGMPYGENTDEVFDWIRPNKERVKMLAAHYDKED